MTAICLRRESLPAIFTMKKTKILRKCFGESTLSRTQVFEWYKAFSEGREVIENLPRVRHLCRPL